MCERSVTEAQPAPALGCGPAKVRVIARCYALAHELTRAVPRDVVGDFRRDTCPGGQAIQGTGPGTDMITQSRLWELEGSDMAIVGSGKYTYEVASGWGKLPKGYRFNMVPGVAVDSQDRIYVFNRTPNVVYVLDREGNFLRKWGEDYFAGDHLHRSHGFHIGPDQNVYLTDIGDHTVRKFTLDGELLLTLGTAGIPGKEGEPFRRPASATISSSGDIFVADGYDNARVHRYSPEGKMLLSWGTQGTGPGQFKIPHGIWVDRDDRVWVAERGNNRIQIFTTEGKLLGQLDGFIGPSEIFMDNENTVYVPELAGRVSILDINGKLLTRWGAEKAFLLNYISTVPGDVISYFAVLQQCLHAPGKSVSCHCCCVDSRGDLYVGEATGQRLTKFIRK